jgi:DinB family protein
MHDDDLDTRLSAAKERLAALSAELETGGPWPLAERFDHSPEASWGPRETLAHLEEMLAYWLGEAERIMESPDEGVAIGRVATDEIRLAIIERDRTLPFSELVARVRVGIDRWRERWAELDEGSRDRTGTHPRLGVVTVTDVASRFAVGHLEEHLDQLAAALGGARAKD